MRLRDACAHFESMMPLRFAEAWDNVGLLFGDAEEALTGVAFCVDLTPAVLAEVRSLGANLVFAYHPPLFRAQKRFEPGDLAFECIRAGVSVFSPHTAFDVCPRGTNDHLATLLGLTNVVPLREVEPGVGMGRVGDLAMPLTLPELASRLKTELRLAGVLAGDAGLGTSHRRIAVAAGSGSDFLPDAKRAGATAFVTGELRHHDALTAQRMGLDTLCTLHSNSERHAVAALAESLRETWPNVRVTMCLADRDPLALI